MPPPPAPDSRTDLRRDAPSVAAAAGEPDLDPGWVVVVPVKGGPLAKTRLRAPSGVDHARLAVALAMDTVAAAVDAVGADRVVVVTSAAGVAADVAALGVVVEPDPATGLDAAVLAGGARALTLRGGRPPRVAALLGDLPSLRARDLVAALTHCAEVVSAFVPDADGVGTVLLTAGPGHDLRPRFGGSSAHAHEQGGARRLDLDLPRLRRDVDDEVSLRVALGLGVGPHTASLLAHLLVPTPGPTP